MRTLGRAAAGAALLVALSGCTDGPDPRAGSAASPSPARTAAPSPTPTAAPAPGPTRTVQASQDTFVFASPTGNLACGLSAVEAVCEIRERTYSPPPKPADCDLDHGAMVAVDTTGPGRFLCYGDTGFVQATPFAPGSPLVAPGEVLPYGESVTNGVFTCTSRETGMTCETVDGRHGFALARARYRLF